MDSHSSSLFASMNISINAGWCSTRSNVYFRYTCVLLVAVHSVYIRALARNVCACFFLPLAAFRCISFVFIFQESYKDHMRYIISDNYVAVYYIIIDLRKSNCILIMLRSHIALLLHTHKHI